MHRRNIFNLRAMFRYPRATHSLPGQTQLLSMRRSFDLSPSTTLHRACETRSSALDSSMVQHSLPNRTDFDGAPGVHIPFAVLFLFAGARVFPPERPHLPFRVPRLDRFRRGISRPTITPTFAGGRSRGFAAAPGENPRAVRSCRSCDVTTGRCCHGLCLLQVFGDLVGPARFRSAHPPAELV
jgi:hypothetical protein